MENMAALSCIACRVRFADFTAQRTHHKSEWHRYNLKRNVVQLPPVSEDAFRQLEASHKASQEEPSKQSQYCSVCRKQFGNEKAFNQHLQSKRHKQLECERPAKLEKDLMKKPEASTVGDRLPSVDLSKPEDATNSDSDSDWTDVGDVEEEDDFEKLDGNPVLPTECLFCSLSNESIHENVLHMSSVHSFFIPDVEYLQDMEGLLTYLGEKVGIGYRCLWCGDAGRSFKSLIAVQRHMFDKGHCKMKYEPGESLVEYSDFYDYSASYPDAANADKDEEIDENELEQTDDWQLVLPSGAVIGHRSLFRYYRQNLKPVTENNQRTRRSIVDKIMSNYRALGWTGTTGEAAVQKAKDIQFFQKMRAKQSLKVMQKNNKINMKHFRSQTGF